MSLSTPVVFLIFNRPELTQAVFAVIAQARPKKLLVVADGPRFPAEADKCRQARAVIDQVDWDCQLLTNFSETNLGCKKRVSSGLDWAFEQVDRAIILEDDCLPDITFFPFCEELLHRYRADTRISMISGNNYLPPENCPRYSYYFSLYTRIWGWATWSRSWKYYDGQMKLWPLVRDEGWLYELYNGPREADFRQEKFERSYTGQINAWGYAWSFSSIIQNGLVIRPCTNLVSNIGFGPQATHTRVANKVANFPRSSISFPLQHPPFVLRNVHLDRCEVASVLGEDFVLDDSASAGETPLREDFWHLWAKFRRRVRTKLTRLWPKSRS